MKKNMKLIWINHHDYNEKAVKNISVPLKNRNHYTSLFGVNYHYKWGQLQQQQKGRIYRSLL